MRPETAVELSQLVALLEAPAFAPLRLQLLQPGQHPALLRAVHGLLMLLPQVRPAAGAGAWPWPRDWQARAWSGPRLCSARRVKPLAADAGIPRVSHSAPAPARPDALQGDAFRMLQTRLQSIPLMALLSMREQQQALALAAGRGGSSAALAAAAGTAAGLSPGGSPPAAAGLGGSRWGSSSTSLDATAAASGEQQVSPTHRQQQQQQQLGAARPPLIEEKRLVQLFKSRVARLGN